MIRKEEKMRVRRLAWILFAVITATTTTAFAQDSLFGFVYNISFPALDTKDFISKESWRGATLEVRKFPAPNLAMGGSVGWHVFDEQTEDVFTFRNNVVAGAVAGKQFRYVNSFPLLVNVAFTGSDDTRLRFLVGTGFGAYYVREKLNLGQISIDNDNWLFGVSPEVGFMLPIGEKQINVTGKWHYMFKNDNQFAHSYVTIKLGLYYPLFDHLY